MALLSTWLMLVLFLFVESQGIVQVTPSRLIFSAGLNVTVNGSSAIGNCVNESSRTTCYSNDPTSTVLFDRGIPTLTGLDGDMWASQLLTIQTTASSIDITFDLRTPKFMRVDRVEVVMFDCPQWGIGVESVSVRALETDATPISTTIISYDVTSCNSLMKVCLEPRTTIPQLALQFTLFRDSNWVHLAEVTFWVGPSTCSPNSVITAPPFFTRHTSLPLPVTENRLPIAFTSTSEATITLETVSDEKTSTMIITESSDIIAIATVTALLSPILLLLVGVVVVVLVLWRCRHQHTAKEEASHTSSQTHKTINLQEIGHIHEEHTQVNDGVVSGSSVDEPEYSAVATNLPSPDSHKPIESGTPPDHLYDQVDEEREKKAYTQQQAQSFKDEDHLYDEVDKQKSQSDTGVIQFSRRQQKFSSPPTTTHVQSDSHDINFDSELQEHHLYAQIGTPIREVDTVEGGVAVSDPTYMEAGAAEEKTFELKQNEAYGAHILYGK